jgi:hypothetical protein
MLVFATISSSVPLTILRSTITPTRLQVRKMVSRSWVIITTVSARLLLQVADHELVEGGGADRVEARGRLVEEQQPRVERQRPRQRGALDHAAGELRRDT